MQHGQNPTDVIDSLLSWAAMQVEPPPAISEDASATELARRRLLKGKRLYLGLPHVPYLNSGRTQGKSKSRPVVEQTRVSNDTAEIDLGDPFPDLDAGQDIYRWAVVYENQRGFAPASFVPDKRLKHHLFPQSHIFFYPTLLSPRTTPP